MAEEKSAKKVPDHVPKVHESGPGLSEEAARILDLSLYEMEHESAAFDESAAGKQYQADVGVGTFARNEGPTTSPKISLHDNLWNTLFNAFPDLESDEVEELMEYVYGQSLYRASRDGFKSFDQARLDEVLSMSQVEVEAFLDNEDEDSEADDYVEEEEEEGADEA